MSHLVDIRLNIGTDADSIAAVKQACKEMGLIFKEGQKTYRWYGRSVGDYPLPQGFTAEDLGKCDHAIEVPGAGYDIGLARRKDGKGYALLFDFWGQGRPILDKLGVSLSADGKSVKSTRFAQIYGVAKAEITARKLGHSTHRQHLKNGTINVLITGSRL